MAVEVRPISTDADLSRAAEFLHEHLNDRVPIAAWIGAVDHSGGVSGWDGDRPNNGMMLVDGVDVVGVYLAFYSRRSVNGRVERICNLGAWCVRPDRRFHGIRLLKALLAQEGFHFVDLSPSGSVVPLNQRLGFEFLDTTTALVPTFPWVWGGAVRSDPALLDATLTGRDRELYHDHVDAAAARHLLLTRDDHWCYVVFRMDRRKRLPGVFASILHVSDTALFHRMLRPLAGYLFARHRALAMLAELRVVDRRPVGSVLLQEPRRKMYRSPSLAPEEIDYFYSELVSVPW